MYETKINLMLSVYSFFNLVFYFQFFIQSTDVKMYETKLIVFLRVASSRYNFISYLYIFYKKMGINLQSKVTDQNTPFQVAGLLLAH